MTDFNAYSNNELHAIINNCKGKIVVFFCSKIDKLSLIEEAIKYLTIICDQLGLPVSFRKWTDYGAFSDCNGVQRLYDKHIKRSNIAAFVLGEEVGIWTLHEFNLVKDNILAGKDEPKAFVFYTDRNTYDYNMLAEQLNLKVVSDKITPISFKNENAHSLFFSIFLSLINYARERADIVKEAKIELKNRRRSEKDVEYIQIANSIQRQYLQIFKKGKSLQQDILRNERLPIKGIVSFRAPIAPHTPRMSGPAKQSEYVKDIIAVEKMPKL